MNLLLSVLQNKVKTELYDKTFTHPDGAEYTNIDRVSIFSMITYTTKQFPL
ncbi:MULTISPECIES: hypothetical protein [unclassified Paenibacillus]|uniref:hypothetical protein n=1 Tax=unclassified Paenibacillus TaxID=185978 RepID=UPI0030FCB1DF